MTSWVRDWATGQAGSDHGFSRKRGTGASSRSRWQSSGVWPGRLPESMFHSRTDQTLQIRLEKAHSLLMLYYKARPWKSTGINHIASRTSPHRRRPSTMVINARRDEGREQVRLGQCRGGCGSSWRGYRQQLKAVSNSGYELEIGHPGAPQCCSARRLLDLVEDVLWASI